MSDMGKLSDLTLAESRGLETKQGIIETARKRIGELGKQLEDRIQEVTRGERGERGEAQLFFTQSALADVRQILDGSLDVSLERYRQLNKQLWVLDERIRRLSKERRKKEEKVVQIRNARAALKNEFEIISWDDD